MSTKAFARTLSSMIHPAGTNLHPNNLLERARDIVLDGYTVVSRYLTRPAHRNTPPEEPASHELQEVHDPPDMEIRERPERRPEQPVYDHSNPALEAGDLEEAVHQTEGREHDPIDGPPSRSNHKQIWMALLIFGTLTLIVTPGLVLGIITGQLPWGIALSGAIATVVSFLAGLYYHLSD